MRSRAVAADTTAGGIIIPDQFKSKVNEGNVIAVGPGARDKDGGLIPMEVKVGDTVLLPGTCILPISLAAAAPRVEPTTAFAKARG
eukprot:COSAG01_NODE_12357_length_1753_cov_2.945586_3_plen_86_part_00